MDEQEAIERLKRRDIKGLETLVMQYQVQALRVANMIVHDRSRAEDIVQGVFIRVYRQIATYDASRPFRPWFIRLVVNEALRVTTGRIDLSFETPLYDDGDASVGDLLPDQQPGPEGEAEAADIRQLIWEALGELLPQERAAITLRYFLDYSEQEMAETLNCAPGTVKWRLHEARKHLKTLLQPLAQPVGKEKKS